MKKISRVIISFSIFITVLALLTSPQITQAAPDAASVLTPVIDTYIDIAAPNTSQDNGLLFAQYGFGPGPDMVILLQFNLSGVPHQIDEARLNMASINDIPGCGIPSDPVPEINVYAAGDFPPGVTWNTAPPQGALLADMDEAVLMGHAHWTDLGTDNLASFLETERNGDGIASLWIELPPGPISQVVFSDVENIGACAGADLVPTLQLADSTGPLAVTLSDFGSSQPNFTMLWIGLGVLLIAAVSLLFYRRRVRQS